MTAMTREQFIDAYRRGRRWFRGVDLRGVDLSLLEIPRVNLRGARLDGAVLAGSVLTSANFSKCNLTGARLWGCRLEHARFIKADLSGADLRHAQANGASFRGAIMRGANLDQANLSGADLSRARGLETAESGDVSGAPSLAGDDSMGSWRPLSDALFPATGGVFELGDANGRVLIIGSSKDIAERMEKLTAQPGPVLKDANCYRYFITASWGLREMERCEEYKRLHNGSLPPAMEWSPPEEQPGGGSR